MLGNGGKTFYVSPASLEGEFIFGKGVDIGLLPRGRREKNASPVPFLVGKKGGFLSCREEEVVAFNTVDFFERTRFKPAPKDSHKEYL